MLAMDTVAMFAALMKEDTFSKEHSNGQNCGVVTNASWRQVLKNKLCRIKYFKPVGIS